MISVILCQTENSGNIGAVARAMKNFGFSELLLLEPKASIDADARNRAKHAQDVLIRAKKISRKELSRFQVLAASTARLGNEYNLPRTALNLEELRDKISVLTPKTKIGILFGPEGNGLDNELLQKANMTFTINTSEKYPSLNLSHAAALTLYTLSNLPKRTDRFTPIGTKQREVLLKTLDARLAKMRWRTERERKTQEKLWRNILGKASLTSREAQALFGFLKNA
jgi:TrmH family RNA methyltransferase